MPHLSRRDRELDAGGKLECRCAELSARQPVFQNLGRLCQLLEPFPGEELPNDGNEIEQGSNHASENEVIGQQPPNRAIRSQCDRVDDPLE